MTAAGYPAAVLFPERNDLMDILNLTSIFPTELTFFSAIKFIGILAAIVIVFGGLFRLICGRKSMLNRGLCAALGILGVYVLTIVIYTFQPAGLERWLSPLPFVKFSGDNLYIMPFTLTSFPAICSEILSMVILALLYHLADSIIPDRDKFLPWLILRFLTVCLAIVIHYYLSELTGSFLPDLIVAYAPTVLTVCLVISLLGGILGILLSLVMTVVNPILGILCGFFFTSKIGKVISKAMLTTAVLCVLVAVLEHFEYTVISINASALISYIPLLAVLLGLWYLIGCKL